MKKFLMLFVFVFLLSPSLARITGFSQGENVCYAETISQEEIDSFEDMVDDNLDNLDFSPLDDILKDFTHGQRSIFGSSSFLGKIKMLINGDFGDSENVWQAIVNVFFESIVSFLPFLSLVVAISLLGSLMQGLKPSSNKGLSNIVHFVTYGVVIVLVLSQVTRLVSLATSAILSIKKQMDTIFPILITMLTAMGGPTSVSIYQPAMAFLTGILLNFFTHILLPIFIFSVIFDIVSNLSGNVKMEKFSSFLRSSFKWIMGIVFTIFTAFLSIQGLTAMSIDGISIRTAKYAMRSYIPILGSYLSDGMGVILASSNLIKNAVGGAGLIMLLASLLSPILELVIFMLILKLTAGIIEPLGNRQVASFITSLSKSMVLLISLLIGVGFVYFIMLGLVMCSANLV
mgnify:CR=1 FL=1